MQNHVLFLWQNGYHEVLLEVQVRVLLLAARDCQAAAWKSGHKATCKQIRRMQKTKK